MATTNYKTILLLVNTTIDGAARSAGDMVKTSETIANSYLYANPPQAKEVAAVYNGSVKILSDGYVVGAANPLSVEMVGDITLTNFTAGPANIEDRTMTPSGKALNVQIGPGDPISNIPVVMEFEHHQVHEGESYLAFDEKLTIGATTVKYSIVVPAGVYPHMVLSADTYDGSVLVNIYETATFTGGTTLTPYNRSRVSLNIAGTSVKTGVTSTNGTKIDSFFAGASKTSGGSQRSMSEFILAPNTTYRVDVIGQISQTKAVVKFFWYEDLGV